MIDRENCLPKEYGTVCRIRQSVPTLPSLPKKNSVNCPSDLANCVSANCPYLAQFAEKNIGKLSLGFGKLDFGKQGIYLPKSSSLVFQVENKQSARDWSRMVNLVALYHIDHREVSRVAGFY